MGMSRGAGCGLPCSKLLEAADYFGGQQGQGGGSRRPQQAPVVPSVRVLLCGERTRRTGEVTKVFWPSVVRTFRQVGKTGEIALTPSASLPYQKPEHFPRLLLWSSVHTLPAQARGIWKTELTPRERELVI